MTKNLEPVVTMILNSFRDSHPRVRWAAINAIGQLSTDLGPDLQQGYHQQVLPALVNAMDDFQTPRVQVCSILFFLSYCLTRVYTGIFDSTFENTIFCYFSFVGLSACFSCDYE